MQFFLKTSFFLGFFLSSLAHGAILTEGKTKILHSYPQDLSLAIFESKDDITTGDGAKHDIIRGKAEIATTTTCNRLLSKLNFGVYIK
ncbi:MAG TPA: phosphoribosylaminoimidazolesuccinocarboxamide synthase [Rhabdochlamydiaceae bacterium]|jgi:phosphoribosylaminoimidazole-succinocarboxamide synthase